MTEVALKIKGAGLVTGEDEESGEVIFEGMGGNEGDIPLVQNPISRGEGAGGAAEMETSKPLAEELLDTVLDLLSFAGFTIPASAGQGADSKVTLAIWYNTRKNKLNVGKRELGAIHLLGQRNL